MYDIKQFLPALYALVIIGITGFAIAVESPGLWIISILFILLNAWIVRRGRFKPIPRVLASLVTSSVFIYCFVYGYQQVVTRTGSPIVTIGQFLVILQTVKLWEQRANRDYAQLLVLSLLLMVAAAISTASIVFGLMLIGYLFLSLYCCLLFHLKVETDEAKAALALPDHELNLVTLKQDQHFLSRSMRRLTSLVSSVAIVCAVAVFLFFPRSTGSKMLGQFQWKPQEAMTGFSEHVGFQQVARLALNNDVVAHVTLYHDDQLVDTGEPLRLRGLTLDYYTGEDGFGRVSYQWLRTPETRPLARDQSLVPFHTQWRPGSAKGTARYRQEIYLTTTGSRVLFSVAGPVTFTPIRGGNTAQLPFQYDPIDESMQGTEALPQQLWYSMEATGKIGREVDPNPYRDRSRIDPLIRQYAQRAEVSGNGLAARRAALVAARPRDVPSQGFITPLDEQIARNIEQHLRSTFSYTLDITQMSDLNGRDPVVAFLYDTKKGHCEYFASAMALMCQSFGMEARVVIGFVCDDYNNVGHYYTVNQSQAHAWVEVLTAGGWNTYDPTSSRMANSRASGAWQKTKQIFDYLQFTWANAVVAYDADNRSNIIQSVESKMSYTVNNSTRAFSGLKNLFDTIAGWLAMRVVGPLIIILSLALLGAIGWFFYEPWQLRRRANRIGINALPPSDQQRLIRQLGFYDDLLRILERHHITRPRHLTPMEFSNTLSYLPAESYDTIHRLTHLYYRIRYGQASLDPRYKRFLENTLNQLSESLRPIN